MKIQNGGSTGFDFYDTPAFEPGGMVKLKKNKNYFCVLVIGTYFTKDE